MGEFLLVFCHGELAPLLERPEVVGEKRSRKHVTEIRMKVNTIMVEYNNTGGTDC